VALSMEEQRILDEMERKLAADDPRLAARFNALGQQRLPGAFASSRARTVSGLLALTLIAAVTVMMFVLSPYSNHRSTGPVRTRPSAGASSARSTAAATKPAVGNH
jgi:Protein of unknown function (DUF3040)